MAYEHRRAGWVTSAALVLGVALVLMTACTDAELVRLDAANTVLTFNASSQTLGFEQADWGVTSLLVQYADPDAREANGDAPFTLITDTIPIDLLGEIKQVEGPSLRPGAYEVVQMVVNGPILTNDDPAAIDDPDAQCWEKISLYSDCITGTQPPYTLDFSGLDEVPRFEARSGDASEIRVVIDSDVLILSYVEAFGCNDFVGGRCSNNVSPCARTAPCPTQFDRTSFQTNAPEAIRFQ